MRKTDREIHDDLVDEFENIVASLIIYPTRPHPIGMSVDMQSHGIRLSVDLFIRDPGVYRAEANEEKAYARLVNIQKLLNAYAECGDMTYAKLTVT